ncbi:patatin-like phospholipase family protein [Ramlibacter sp. MAH-25]|uniref:Patatin-like phospholipase family protein n=1 Tax=Ramlibacter pinisoli TaxID=2682844 RepID=A0A6N8IXQ2_9BURK|nr:MULTISPECIES: patatin-like phospholipase family protein [Ramlibacter]MBA2961822.1 patatin-like phospholipase family protein [Ramlibacter sp. CGMCC 1.13660]MVQ31764.1 patatin-like phospholipase family protein [Ramlibacter pinisoli]
MSSQVVLVFQGGGALGAYQAGVYEAMHERGIEPDWVIGTSIGAINAAIIAGNRPEHRLARLHAFWDGVQKSSPLDSFLRLWPGASGYFGNVETIVHGIPGFFAPNPASWVGMHFPLGVEGAAYYSTEQLRSTLASLVDFELVRACRPRLTVGAVNVRTGAMRYFDSRKEALAPDHVMASGALPPAFPAIRIDGEPYWDGGIYSNTPIEAVLEDTPRRDSVIFSVNVWRPQGDEPDTIWRVIGRQKDIQYASRADSHIEKQKQLHRLRHVIRELGKQLPPARLRSAEVKDLMAWGCGTTMHVVRLLAPGLDGEDHTKDIDFTAEGIRSRWMAGYSDTLRAIDRRPWEGHEDAIEGVIVHEPGRAPIR